MAERKTQEQFIEEMALCEPNVEILGEYKNAKTSILCRCKIHNCKYTSIPDHLLHRGSGCPMCAKEKRNASHKKKTHEQFIKDAAQKNPHIKIRGRYTGVLDNIECECKICGGVFDQVARKIMEGVGCPICAGVRIVPGINDIATTNPEVVRYFKDPSEAKKYSKGCNVTTWFKCPDCGFEKKTMICYVVQRGSMCCPKCDDGVSYPNKFSRSLLSQLNVENLIYEYSPEWACHYRYDNYFEYKGQRYILEMDGGFHYIKYYKSNLSLEETQRIDALKDQLAFDHNITIIRIDCFYSEKNYIIKNIKSSFLAELFDLSKIDWEKCNLQATKSIVKEICDFYNAHTTYSVKKIAETFYLNETTVSNYLYKGNELGFCSYYPANKIRIKVHIEDQDFSFNTINECVRSLSKLYHNIPWSMFKVAAHKRDTDFRGIKIQYI